MEDLGDDDSIALVSKFIKLVRELNHMSSDGHIKEVVMKSKFCSFQVSLTSYYFSASYCEEEHPPLSVGSYVPTASSMYDASINGK